MPRIELRTKIRADINNVFDLTRSVDFHKISAESTMEKAVAGRTGGLLEAGETVTWRAKHLGIYQNLTSRVTGFKRPVYFADEMVSGAFKNFKHEHFFSGTEDGTLMIDIFEYESPLGYLGKIADALFLKRYMTRFLSRRNESIKNFMETGRWEDILNTRSEG